MTVHLRGNEVLAPNDKVVARIDDYYRTPMGDVVFLKAGQEAPKDLREGLLKVKFYAFSIVKADKTTSATSDPLKEEKPKQPLKEEVKKHEDGIKSKFKKV